jgi:hypothetical protein
MPPQKRRTDAAGSGSVPLDDIDAAKLDAPEIDQTRGTTQEQTLGERLRFKVEGGTFDEREAFALLELSVVRGVRREEVRNARGHNPNHEEKMRAERARYRRYLEAYRHVVGLS